MLLSGRKRKHTMIATPLHDAKIALTVDTLIFSVSSTAAKDTRKLSEKHLSILLVKRRKAPFEGQWCVPGGFIKSIETLEDAAERVLMKETNLTGIYKEQLHTFSEVGRDPRARVVSVAFLSLVDQSRITSALNEDAAWFRVDIIEHADHTRLHLTNATDEIICEFTRTPDVATGMYRYTVHGSQALAFDHSQILMVGLESLRRRTSNTSIVFNIMPEEFTLRELQQVHEVILGRTLWVPAFRKTIAHAVSKTGHMTMTGGHRPSALYRYINKEDK